MPSQHAQVPTSSKLSPNRHHSTSPMKTFSLSVAFLLCVSCAGSTPDAPAADTANPPLNDTRAQPDGKRLPPDASVRPEDIPPPDAECIPNCDDKSCGPDGCGGECQGLCGGDCDPETGLCIDECIPVCGGKSCGEDQCGGTCGECKESLDTFLNANAMKAAIECAETPDVGPTPAAIASCLTAGIGLSEQCADCYGDLVGCMVSVCVMVCTSQSQECMQCLIANNCSSAFSTCAGFDLFESGPPSPNP